MYVLNLSFININSNAHNKETIKNISSFRQHIINIRWKTVNLTCLL